MPRLAADKTAEYVCRLCGRFIRKVPESRDVWVHEEYAKRKVAFNHRAWPKRV